MCCFAELLHADHFAGKIVKGMFGLGCQQDVEGTDSILYMRDGNDGGVLSIGKVDGLGIKHRSEYAFAPHGVFAALAGAEDDGDSAGDKRKSIGFAQRISHAFGGKFGKRIEIIRVGKSLFIGRMQGRCFDFAVSVDGGAVDEFDASFCGFAEQMVCGCDVGMKRLVGVGIAFRIQDSGQVDYGFDTVLVKKRCNLIGITQIGLNKHCLFVIW